ncbi:GNAT family N-acetyltransferase [Dysgonomonas sp. GY617]|uniref:GNAT family N-acetyltransferase n=1 Tax=Dysgonomonas sp. GY617 TaxID=2780420 RepID=UPI00188444CC|nr:GNAT family N-acetyltransferase [Dysgonomonas sp. GY617]MBF0574560.1 GNAT family N-acetyltransferase [Dysgonomonas sp. GY617]
MKYILETERLYLREIDSQDVDDLFEMDSDPEVHKYIENKPVKFKEQIVEVIEMLRAQYKKNGIARWAVVYKQSGECIGWAGLKYFSEPLNNHSDFYELGYRLKKKHWGKGYVTEAATSIVKYGFENLGLDIIYATAHTENDGSINVLKKLGFKFTEVFDYEGDPTNWFELQKTN